MINTMIDVCIISAGLAGLSLAKLLSGQGRTIAILKLQPLTAIEKPPFDGREIALTQHLMSWLTEMGVALHFKKKMNMPL
ncbi:MAG: 2-polyprenyl-6-methoxyphenol hydroxylase-like FAD-dependent oxidoreductase [Methylophilaceae bacterium]|jgi:2-polyprenyl-6-methoxyphenol hydroxylase-like FAD-dependent oxidoreductase